MNFGSDAEYSLLFHLKNGSLLQWWNPAIELATSINCCILILRKGGNPEMLPELREIALKNFLKPVLSRDPQVGLRALAPSIREQEIVNPGPPGYFSCIQIASALVSAIYISLQEKPDPALSKYVLPFHNSCTNLLGTPGSSKNLRHWKYLSSSGITHSTTSSAATQQIFLYTLCMENLPTVLLHGDGLDYFPAKK
jgi:hypothetical protein